MIKSIFIFLLIYSCSLEKSFEKKKVRIPSSQSFSTITNILSTIKKDTSVDTEKLCKSKTLEDYYKQLFSLNSSQIDFLTLSLNDKERLIDQSFNLRIKLRSHFDKINSNYNENAKCYSDMRNLSRALRYLEDYIVENITNSNPFEIKNSERFKTLEGAKGSFFIVSNKFKDTFKSHKDLKSGDIILSRGKAYTSAAISRIGLDDAQFSHLSFVYKDEQGKLHTTESHIEIGNIVMPIQAHLDQSNARTVVFRYKDSKPAHLASKCVYEKVKKEQDKGKVIEYDFGMNYEKSDRIFCSEVAHIGFKCLEEPIDIPQVKMKFPSGLHSFLSQIGVEVTKENIVDKKTFGPGDLEFDSRFEIVAEWRNPINLKDIRQKDAILSKMFEWMERENFKLKPKFLTKAKSKAGYWARRNKVLQNKRINKTWKKIFKKDHPLYLVDQFPKNMTQVQMNTFTTLDTVAIPMQERLEKVEKRDEKLLSFQEMLNELDRYKIEDKFNFENKNTSDWYELFSP